MLRAIALICLALPAEAQEVTVAWLRQQVPPPPVLTEQEEIPADRGLAGARLAMEDNATTGRFMGQAWTLSEHEVPPGGDLDAAAREALAATPFVVLDMPEADVLRVADLPEAAGAILLNAASGRTALRDADCRANLLHAMPSDAMRADALMQHLVSRRWTDLAMLTGSHPDDLAFAEALRRSAAKFGLRLRSEKGWDTSGDFRRAAAAEVPLLTQDLRDHDVLLVADEIGDWARFVLFNQWSPRPVAGSEGMTPTAWSPVLEQWGAAQLQSRFRDLAARPMGPRDYAAWASIRALGEAVTRTGSAEPATIRAYLLGPEFELAGFKGRPLSFRPWNGQLRQPVPLVHPRALIAQPPLEGFLHPTSELDTLGLDAPESACEVFE